MTNVDAKYEAQTQVTTAATPVYGTPYALHYRSDRTPGYGASSTVDIPVSGEDVPASLKRIVLELTVAGQRHEFEFPPRPNQTHSFEWDGVDGFDREAPGVWPLRIRLGYVYDGVYATPAEAEASFARFADPTDDHFVRRITGSRTRDELTYWAESETQVGTSVARSRGLGGWSLGVHHRYSPTKRLLELGWGRTREAATMSPQITTVAGGPQGFRPADVSPGELATETPLHLSQQVAVDADGVFYLPDRFNNRVYAVGEDGVLTVVAGTGTRGFDGDGGPATEAAFSGPNDVAVGPDGSLYVSDSGNGRIRRVDPDGVVETVAGGGDVSVLRLQFSGESVRATDAQLIFTDNVAVGADGLVTFQTAIGSLLLRVEADGTLAHVFGAPGFDSPREPGVLATRYNNTNITDTDFGPDGALYVIDSDPVDDDRIVRVRPSDGIVEMVVGGGDTPLEPGLAANEVRLAGNSLQGLAVGPDDRVYFTVLPAARASNATATSGSQVYVVGEDGFVTPVAGRDSVTSVPVLERNDPGDGGPATQARLVWPAGIDVGPDGGLYIADGADGRIRLVLPVAFPGSTLGTILVAAESGDEFYEFDQSGYHLRTLDALTGGTRQRFRYTADGQLLAVEDGDGNVTNVLRDGDERFAGLVSPDGHRTTVEVGGNGYITAITNPASETTRLTYDGGGLLTRVTDPLGNSTRFNYGSNGLLTAVTAPTGGRTRLRNRDSEAGRTVTITSPESRETTYVVDQPATGVETQLVRRADIEGRLERKADGTIRSHSPDGGTVTGVEAGDPRFGMQAPYPSSMRVGTPGGLEGEVTTVQTVDLANEDDPLTLSELLTTVTVNGVTATATYDGSSRTLTGTSSVGRVTETLLDEVGRLAEERFGDLAPLRFEYDDRGRPVEVVQAGGGESRSTTVAYGANGYPSSLADPLGNTTSFTYDEAGRVRTRTEPGGQTTTFEYDADDNLTAVVTAAGHRYEMSHDAAGRVVSLRPPAVGSGSAATTFAYDDDGLLTAVERRDGSTVQYQYDRSGRLRTVVLSAGRIGFSYDGSTGQVATITAPSGVTLDFERDGPLLTDVSWRGPISGSLAFTYDENMRVVEARVNGGNAVTIERDDDGLATQVGDYALTRDDATGQVLGGRLGSVVDEWTRDGFGRIDRHAVRRGSRSLYVGEREYDLLNRLVVLAETTDGTSVRTTFQYDSNGQLTESTRDGETTTYTYDEDGNRTEIDGPEGPETATFDARGRLRSQGDVRYSYSDDDERVSRTEGSGTTRYEYDDLSRLTAVALPDGTRIEYVLDGFGRRVGKRVDGAIQQGLLFRDFVSPLAELDASGRVRTRFVYATGQSVPEYMVRDGTVYRLITDALGSLRAVVDTTSGDVVQQIDYDAFGRILRDTNPGFQPFGFRGGLYDPDTRLVHFGGRDYDPEVGQRLAA